jgi:hypothetical protein
MVAPVSVPANLSELKLYFIIGKACVCCFRDTDAMPARMTGPGCRRIGVNAATFRTLPRALRKDFLLFSCYAYSRL